MLPASLIQTKIRLNLKNKVALGIQSSSAAGSSAAGSPAAGTAVAGTAVAGTAVAGTAVAGSAAYVTGTEPPSSAAPVYCAYGASCPANGVYRSPIPVRSNLSPIPVRANVPKSTCTVPPPPCPNNYHLDDYGDCVSDVSIPPDP